MKQFIKSTIALLTVLLFLLSFACSADTSPSNENDASKDVPVAASDAPSSAPDAQDEQKTHITDDSDDNIKFDADITLPESAKKGTLRYPGHSLIKLDPDKVAEVFSDYLSTKGYEKTTDNSLGFEENFYFYTTKNSDEHLSMNDNLGGLTFMNKYSDDLSHAFIYNPMKTYDDPDFQKELSFESRESVVKRVRDMAAQLGLELCDDEALFALDKEKLAVLYEQGKETAANDLDHTPEWKDTYFIYINLACDGVPVFDIEYDSSVLGYTTLTSALTVEVTEDGIKLFDAHGFTAAQGDQETTQIISVDHAVAALKKAYEDVIISGDPYNVYNISMYYLPKGDKFTPAYCFKYSQKEFELDHVVLISAVTGEII